jgi:hypothetical protein
MNDRELQLIKRLLPLRKEGGASGRRSRSMIREDGLYQPGSGRGNAAQLSTGGVQSLFYDPLSRTYLLEDSDDDSGITATMTAIFQKSIFQSFQDQVLSMTATSQRWTRRCHRC